MCIYGMDSPGGYQLIGRTVPIWNKFKKNKQFGDQQWFLRFFDQIKYYEVTEAELDQFRADFAHGLAEIKIEECEFDFAAYQDFLAAEQDSIATFKAQQQAAFSAEVERWKDEFDAPVEIEVLQDDTDYSQYVPLNASMTGNIWKIFVEAGQIVKKGDTVAIIEAMKMELPVYADDDGIVKGIICRSGQTVHSGEPLVYME